LFESLRPKIRQVADELIERVKPKGKLDGIWDLAYPLPATVIADLIGIPVEHRVAFKKSSDAFVELVGPSRPSLEKALRAQKGLSAMIDFLRPVYAERRAKPQDDMMTVLMNCEVEGNLLDEEEVLVLCASLAIGGHETTTNLIGNGLLALMRNPEQREKLQQHPEIITTAVDEILRYDSPLQRVLRVAKQDIEIGGQPIGQGEIVLGMLGAANHDPAEFPDPDRLDLERAENRHLAFGQASRFCLGAQLARIEGQVVLSRVLEELPKLHLTDPGPVWNENVGFRGLKTLPLAF
jgi:cytochrome P450